MIPTVSNGVQSNVTSFRGIFKISCRIISDCICHIDTIM